MQTPKIFLSYCWSNSDIAQIIDDDFRQKGITLIRDVRDVEYRQSLKKYMQGINNTDFVTMLIGDAFLKSQNCMYEVLELINSRTFESKILPITVGDASFFRTTERAKYYDYWDAKISEAQEHLAKYNTADYAEDLRHYKNIRNNLQEFFDKITDLNSMSFEQMKASDYEPIMKLLPFSLQSLVKKLIELSGLTDFEIRDLAFQDLIREYGEHYLIFFHRAVLYKKEKKYKLSRRNFERTLELSPNFLNAYNDYALLLEEHFNEPDKARALYETALKKYPKFEAVLLNYANLLELHYKDFQKAKKTWELAVQVNPGNKKFHNNYAIILMDHFGEYDLAETHYLKALEIDQDYAMAAYGLTNLYEYKLKTPEKAWKYYPTALNHENPEKAYQRYAIALEQSNKLRLLEALLNNLPFDSISADTLINLAEIAWRTLKSQKQVEGFFRIALSKETSNPRIYNRYGIFAEYEIFDYELARENYELAIHYHPGSGIYHYNLAYLLETHFNQPDKAMSHYKSALIYDPRMFEAYLNMANMHYVNGQIDESVSKLKQVLALSPEQKNVFYILRAICENYPEKRVEIKKIFNSSLTLFPENYEIRYCYARALEAENYEDAKKEYEAALLYGGNKLYIVRDFVYFQMATGMTAELADIVNTYLHDYPDDHVLLSYYGAILFSIERYEQALGVLEKVIQLAPADEELQALHAAAYDKVLMKPSE
jgi:tetratricopeptide (TPR) repeat protein